MNRRPTARRWASALGLGMLVAGAALVGAAPAQAADLGMTITPTTGSNQVSPTFELSNGCPGGTTSYAGLIFGGSFPSDGQLILNPGNIGLSGLAFTVQASISFQDAAADAGFSTLSGTYTAKVICQDDLSNVLRTFSAPVTFSSPTAYTTPAGASPSPTPTPTPTVTGSPSPTPTSSGSPSPTASSSPTPTASAAGGVTITDQDGALLGDDPVLTPGQTVTIVADGFEPDEEVSATLHSTPVTLDPATADADGAVAYVLVVPTDTAEGEHSLVLAGADETVTVAFSVTAVDASESANAEALPQTGSSKLLPGVFIGLCLIALGWIAVEVARRHGLLRFGGDGDAR
jgi:hypothetical protein